MRSLSTFFEGRMFQECGDEKTGVKPQPKAGYFDHERWDVYQAAVKLVILISDVVEQLPRRKAYLADQLQRAGTSVPLNIAEGAGEHSASEKARFYRMSKRSATECASIPKMIQKLVFCCVGYASNFLASSRLAHAQWPHPQRRCFFGGPWTLAPDKK